MNFNVIEIGPAVYELVGNQSYYKRLFDFLIIA